MAAPVCAYRYCSYIQSPCPRQVLHQVPAGSAAGRVARRPCPRATHSTRRCVKSATHRCERELIATARRSSRSTTNRIGAMPTTRCRPRVPCSARIGSPAHNTAITPGTNSGAHRESIAPSRCHPRPAVDHAFPITAGSVSICGVRLWSATDLASCSAQSTPLARTKSASEEYTI